MEIWTLTTTLSVFVQAFVRLSNENSEIIFVAEADSNALYKFDLDVSAKSKEFGSKSGKYGVHLIIGDSVISNSVSWHLADINLKFSGEDEVQQVSYIILVKKLNTIVPTIQGFCSHFFC